MKIFVTSAYSYWGRWSPDDLTSGKIQVGGGETAMISVSRELAALGHDVTVFYDTAYPGKFSGVNYLPLAQFVPLACMMEHDAMICWDASYMLRFADRAKVHVLAFQLNDATLGVFDQAVDLYAHPSQWHANMFHKIYPEMQRTKSLVQITNGISFERYADILHTVGRNPYKVVYTSSPDRGLHHLLRLWPLVLQAQPQAELHVFYDINRWLELDEQIGERNVTHERAAAIRNYLKAPLPSIRFHGGVGQAELAREQLSASVLAYPCDPVRPTEGFSMTVLEGITAGCSVITSDADAFPELWSTTPNVTMLPLPVDDNLWAEAIVANLDDRPRDTQYCARYQWKTLGRIWEEELLRCLNKQSIS